MEVVRRHLPVSTTSNQRTMAWSRRRCNSKWGHLLQGTIHSNRQLSAQMRTSSRCCKRDHRLWVTIHRDNSRQLNDQMRTRLILLDKVKAK